VEPAHLEEPLIPVTDDDVSTIAGDDRAITLEGRDKHPLKAPEYYLNRELTWLAFNRRVLAEARDERNPLLERVKFLAISAGTLDEFVMKRMGGLKQQVGAGLHVLTVDGRTPQEQIEECEQIIAGICAEQNELLAILSKQLNKHDIHLCSYDQLDGSDREFLREFYLKNIFPLVTPQAVDPAHPFPFISNLSLNLLVTVRYRGEDELSLARVKVPIGRGIPRFLRVGHQHRYVPLEQVMANNLDLLFPGMKIESCELFRVTRNANTEREEEQADDLLALIESELRDRRFAPIVRLEVAEGMNPVRRGMLGAELELDPDHDVIEVSGMLALAHLLELINIDMPELRDPPHHPMDHPKLLDRRNVFNIIRDEKSILLMHPYQSFTSSVERFVREAANDPKVLAIKCTIYRTSDDSRIIGQLIDAARNGKQVAVVVELKARFDEAANIRWANTLEEMGIHVTYGVVGLKTHCKCILVVRRDYDGLRRYAHIGTGNYHAGTARLYSDIGLLTCDEDVGADLTELFNYLTTGYRPGRQYKKLLVAPKPLKRELLAKIEREISLHSKDEPGLIQFKTNALEDPDITRALYKASQAGVTVTLLVRDTCRLRPGVPGLSDNIEVISVVGRFLEHARIYYFRNGGDEEYYVGSADIMGRNLKSRVEVLAPIELPALREELRYFIDSQLADNRGAWVMLADGGYERREPSGDKKARSCQAMMIDYAEKRLRQATRLRKRKPKGLFRRNTSR
jgi:polyphosphate kinase